MTIHILIIAQSHTQSQLHQHSLTEAGYTVMTADNAKTVQTQLQEFCPDIIIIERSLPGLDVARLCQKIKAGCSSPFIFALNEDKIDESDSMEGFAFGVDAYLTKPVGEAELLDRVHTVASLWQAHRELEKREREYALITANVTDLIGRISFTGEFQYVSPSSQAFLGCDPEEVVGRIVDDWLHPDDQALIDEIPHLLSGEVSEATFEHRILHRNGRYTWVETNVHVLDNHADKGELVFVARDISQRKQVESQLYLLSKALKAAEQAIVITNREGIVEWANPAFTTLTGYSSEEIIGKNPRILKSDRNSPAFYAQLWQTILAKEIWHGELINRRKDGREYVEEMTISPVINDDEEITHFIAIKQDVTADREAQENLRQSERRYRTLVRHLPDIILRYDRQCRFIYVSENIVEVSGIQAQDYVGKTHHEVDLTPEWADYWQTELINVMDTGVSSDGEYLHEGENGRFYLYWRLIPEFNSKGEVTGALGIFQDISERHHNEMLLNKQQAIARIASSLRQAVTRGEMLPIILSELLLIMEASGDALVTPDLQAGEWVVELAQGEYAHLIGTRLPAENVLTNQIFALGKPYINNEIHNEPGLPLRDELGSVQAAAGLPMSIHGNELGIIWIGRIHPFLPDDIDLFAAITDIAASSLFRAALFEETQQQALLLTERVYERTAALSLANAQLSAALHSRDLFLANMSHELRTPLSIIILRTEILQDQIYGSLNLKQTHALEIIHQSADHQLALISDILDVIKIEAGQVELDPETVSISDVFQSSSYMVQALAQKKQINITFQVIPEDLYIVADSRRLKQILVNLLTNAIKFTPENGKVGLVVDNEPDGAVRFTVWDTGIGVYKEDISKMFEPFVQIDNGFTKNYEGAGFGLALVRRLIELHGGTIQVDSQVNEGTQISFTLPQPIKKDPIPTNDISSKITQKNEDADKPKVKVLLAEDTKLLADGIMEYLSALNYEIVVAQNGLEALEKIGEFMPNIVLMDIHMPVMDGLEAIKRIRSYDTQISDVPIVALTALAMPNDSDRCLETGATTYLSKPFSLTELKAVINDLLEE